MKFDLVCKDGVETDNRRNVVYAIVRFYFVPEFDFPLLLFPLKSHSILYRFIFKMVVMVRENLILPRIGLFETAP